MKRIHLFEIEDFDWCPDWIRRCMTRLIVVMHKILGTKDDLTDLVARALKHSRQPAIIDLCSGSGGPMIAVFKALTEKYQLKDLSLTLTDLYPNQEMAKKINSQPLVGIHYSTTPVNAAAIDPHSAGVRTMVCSMHHMKPEVARHILKNAKESSQPICIYEISDNSFPIWLWWIAIPIIFVVALAITPLARPMSWQQLVFTYLIPIIPLFFAWDGAVSNARTYTCKDLDELLQGLNSKGYTWEKGIIAGKAKKLYLLGFPKIVPSSKQEESEQPSLTSRKLH